MAENVADWRSRIKDRIRQQYPPGLRYDDDAERRFDAIMNIPVPSDDELIALQERGQLPSDEELAREERLHSGR
jgi:hypothetical protein